MRVPKHVLFIASFATSLLTGCADRPELITQAPQSGEQLAAAVTTLYLPDYTGDAADKRPPLTENGVTYRSAYSVRTTYDYDEAQRLIRERHTDLDRPADPYAKNRSQRYTFVDDRTMRQTNLGFSEQPFAEFNFSLNERGLVSTDRTYDADGYKLTDGPTTRTVRSGNVTRETRTDGSSTLTTDYEYQQAPNTLPDPLRVFNGTPNRNRLARAVRTPSPITPNTVYARIVTTYTYRTDQQGRITECSARDEFFPAQGGSPGQTITVTQYSYR